MHIKPTRKHYTAVGTDLQHKMLSAENKDKGSMMCKTKSIKIVFINMYSIFMICVHMRILSTEWQIWKYVFTWRIASTEQWRKQLHTTRICQEPGKIAVCNDKKQ